MADHALYVQKKDLFENLRVAVPEPAEGNGNARPGAFVCRGKGDARQWPEL